MRRPGVLGVGVTASSKTARLRRHAYRRSRSPRRGRRLGTGRGDQPPPACRGRPCDHRRRERREGPGRRGRARRVRQHRLDRRVRRPDRPDRLQRLEGRRGRHDRARGARPRLARHPRVHDCAGPLRHPAAGRPARGAAQQARRGHPVSLAPRPPDRVRRTRVSHRAEHDAQRRGHPARRGAAHAAPVAMAEDLSPADRSSLSAEQGPVNMTVGGALIFEGGPGISYDEVLERVAGRLHLIPRYRQRLEKAVAGVTHPVWVDDEGFDLGWHVRHTTTEDLQRYVGHELSRRLDRSRPLWELAVVDGLASGRVALVPKMHHALVDGVAAVDIGTVVLDPTPEPLDIAPDEQWAPQPYDRGRHLARLAATPMVKAQQLLLDSANRALAATDPRRATTDLRQATELLAELARTRPQAPMTFLNRSIGPNRRYATAHAPLAVLKTAGKSAGGTVNDAILAAVAGMLGRLLQEAGERPARPPAALVPISVRRPGEEGGN